MSFVPQITIPVESFIEKESQSKKIKAARKRWSPSHVLVNVDRPQLIEKGNDKIKKLFKIRFQFSLKDTKKRWSKTVFFGDQSDYVFSKDERKRILRFQRLSNQNDPFHPNYWRLHLLNSQPSVKAAYEEFMRKFINCS